MPRSAFRALCGSCGRRVGRHHVLEHRDRSRCKRSREQTATAVEDSVRKSLLVVSAPLARRTNQSPPRTASIVVIPQKPKSVRKPFGMTGNVAK